jgi:hypothetical protein
MVLRIRFGKGPKLGSRRNGNRKAATAAGVLLTPAAVLASVVAAWRIAADLKVANTFAFTSGPFSHWQVWLGAAAGLQLCSRMLNRYGKGEDTATS